MPFPTNANRPFHVVVGIQTSNLTEDLADVLKYAPNWHSSGSALTGVA
jgi:hypothetical protein